MDKCPKNMTLVALNIFGLITILDFFQDTFVSIFKTKRPSDYFAFFSFLLCGGQAYFYIFVFGLLGSTTGRGPHFFFLRMGAGLWPAMVSARSGIFPWDRERLVDVAPLCQGQL